MGMVVGFNKRNMGLGADTGPSPPLNAFKYYNTLELKGKPEFHGFPDRRKIRAFPRADPPGPYPRWGTVRTRFSSLFEGF
jgi:hypothetical protein